MQRLLEKRRSNGPALHALLCALLLMSPLMGSAQEPAAAGGRAVTRAELEASLRELEQRAAQPELSAEARQRASADAHMIRQRLEDGDLQVGDRVVLRVEGQAMLTDTFTVATGRVLLLPEVGEVPLRGVLWSELAAHVNTYVSRVFRNAPVRVRGMIRLQITGAVGRPGFYSVASDAVLSDVVMQVGGPNARAAVDRMRVLRGGQVVLAGSDAHQAMLTGRTLDQLNIRAGDIIEIPERRNTSDMLRTGLAVISGIATLVFLLSRN